MKTKQEENNMKKEYPKPKEEIIIPKRKLTRRSPHEYPILEESFDNGFDDGSEQT
jgi:hypothetical protein